MYKQAPQRTQTVTRVVWWSTFIRKKERKKSRVTVYVSFRRFTFRSSRQWDGLNLLTRHQIPEAYGSHRHEAKIKSIEEVPVVFPQHKHTRAAGEVQKQKSDRCQSSCNGTRNEPVTTRRRCKCLQRAAYKQNEREHDILFSRSFDDLLIVL